MKTLSRLLAASSFVLLAAPLARAAPAPLSILTCTATDGSTALTAPVYAYTFEAGVAESAATRFLTVYTDTALLNKLLVLEFFGSTFDNCSFSNGLGTSISNITIQSVTSSGSLAGLQESAKTQAMSSITMSYSLLFVGPERIGPDTKVTPDQKLSALNAFKARGLALPKSGD